MTFLLAAFSYLAAAKDPLPTILIVSHAGNIIAWRPEDHDKFAHFGLEVAIWETGRIVWGKVEKKPNGRLYRQCYEGMISPGKVAEALHSIKAKGAFKARSIYSAIACGGGTDVVVRSKAQSLHWYHSGKPELAYPADPNPESWRRSVEAWNLVQRKSLTLIPKSGRRTAPITYTPIELAETFPFPRA